MKPDVYKKKKEADAKREKLYRSLKKLGLVQPKKKLDDPIEPPAAEAATAPVTSAPQSTPHQIPESNFSSKQSKFRSLSRAEKALPNSPNKKKEVVGALAKKNSLRIAMTKKPGRKTTELNPEEEEWLHEFLDRGDISYINPGRKDNVYIGKKDGKSQYVQKRYLLWKLHDLFEIINGPGVEIKDTPVDNTFVKVFGKELPFSVMYSFFKRYKQYVFNKHIPQSTCLCEICENVSLLAKGLNKCVNAGLPTNAHDIVGSYSCDSSSSLCMLGTV